MSDVVVLSESQVAAFPDHFDEIGLVETGAVGEFKRSGRPTALLLALAAIDLMNQAANIGGQIIVLKDPVIKRLGFITQQALVYQWRPVSLEDGERALQELAEIQGVSVEEMRMVMDRIHRETLERMKED